MTLKKNNFAAKPCEESLSFAFRKQEYLSKSMHICLILKKVITGHSYKL